MCRADYLPVAHAYSHKSEPKYQQFAAAISQDETFDAAHMHGCVMKRALDASISHYSTVAIQIGLESISAPMFKHQPTNDGPRSCLELLYH